MLTASGTVGSQRWQRSSPTHAQHHNGHVKLSRNRPKPLHLTRISPEGAAVKTAGMDMSALKDEIMQEVAKQTEQLGGKCIKKFSGRLEELFITLEKSAKEQADKPNWEDLVGEFRVIMNTTDNASDTSETTLGILTFQQFAPQGLRIKLGEDGFVQQSVEFPGHYSPVAPFTVIEGDHAGLKGYQQVLGKYSVDDEVPIRQNVLFTGIRIKPADSSPEGLKAWLAAMKEGNPTMGDDGVATVEFPQPIKTWRDFLYLDRDVEITLGSRGGYVIVVRKT